MRQEHEHAAHPAEDALDQQAAQHALVHVGANPGAHRFHAAGDHFHRRRSPAEHGLEYEEHDGRQQQRSDHRVQHDVVDLFGQVAGVVGVAGGGGQNAAHLALGLLDADGVDGR